VYSSSDTAPIASIGITLNDDPLGGISLALYVAGCPRRCPGCHSPSLQLPEAGHRYRCWEVEEKVTSLYHRGLVESIVFLGGDWIPWYADLCERLCCWAKDEGVRSVLYTGELYENIPDGLKLVCEWVIDGLYDETRPSVYPASSNQRVFRDGELVNPASLPLYRHLSS
jgi:anaerobic ribonucleoside-triphosphate reductase activating protein